jgi:hypothetical protein
MLPIGTKSSSCWYWPSNEKESPMSRCLEAFSACLPAVRNTELSMAEALNDPLIRTVMEADGVDPEALETVRHFSPRKDHRHEFS